MSASPITETVTLSQARDLIRCLSHEQSVLLLSRRIGEHTLPPGTWVVAAGNRAEDKALVRTISSALINRVLILNVRIDVQEWLGWARNHGVRNDVVWFIERYPDALLRPVPDRALPFSTPRAWASLSRALELVETRGK